MNFPIQITPNDDDERFMLEALKEAWKAYQEDEVPVGAVIVKKGKIIARGHNRLAKVKATEINQIIYSSFVRAPESQKLPF